MRNLRGVAVLAVLLVMCAQPITAAEPADASDRSTALVAHGAGPFPTVMRLRPTPESTVDTSGNNVIATTGTSDSNSAFIVRNLGTTELFRVRSDGKVGIGTSNPLMNLHVAGQYAEVEFNNSGQSPATLFLAHSRGSAGAPTSLIADDLAGMLLFGAYIGTGYANAGRIDSVVTATNSTNVNADLVFRAANLNGGNFEAMRLTAGGNLGIGTTLPPTHKLEVNGDAYFFGAVTGTNIRANYQDVAEWVPTSQELEPGTVVVLRPGKEVAASTAAYDTKVAGVVSAQPGIILGVSGPDKVKVATTGRVLVRVDATQHPISVGDLLVTSGVLGAAMYSEPIEISGVKIHRPGTIIGKALEPLESGTKEILVLLSLQ
jgi:hypothetical protein